MEQKNDEEFEGVSTLDKTLDRKDYCQDDSYKYCEYHLSQKVAEAIGSSFHAHDLESFSHFRLFINYHLH